MENFIFCAVMKSGMPGKLDSGCMVRTLGLRTPGLWKTGRLDFGRLDSERLDVGHLYSGPRKYFQFLVTSISFFLLFNVEFLYISNALRLIYYDFIERAANYYYNLNPLQLTL